MRNGNHESDHVIGQGSPEADLTDDELRTIVREALSNIPSGSRVLALIPDKTRDDNTHVLFPAAVEILSERGVAKFDALVAQGTHGPMSDADKLVKIGDPEKFSGSVFDHKWDDPNELITIGQLASEQVREITGGLLNESIPLSINRLLA